MLAKLDGLGRPPEAGGCPDISLLGPEEQDRVDELANKIGNPHTGIGTTISDKELAELEGLLADLPELGPGDKPAGPKIEADSRSTKPWGTYLARIHRMTL